MKREWKIEATYLEDGEVTGSDLAIEHDSDDKELPFTIHQPGTACYASREEFYGLIVAGIRALAATDGVSPPEVLRTVVAVLMVDGSGAGNSTSHQP